MRNVTFIFFPSTTIKLEIALTNVSIVLTVKDIAKIEWMLQLSMNENDNFTDNSTLLSSLTPDELAELLGEGEPLAGLAGQLVDRAASCERDEHLSKHAQIGAPPRSSRPHRSDSKI